MEYLHTYIPNYLPRRGRMFKGDVRRHRSISGSRGRQLNVIQVQYRNDIGACQMCTTAHN